MNKPSRPYIRAARAGDREAVLEFSRHTWDWGDYIPLVWEHWLAQTDGRLLVTTLNGRPVALGNVVMAAPKEAWLEGTRVDPDRRRTGLATGMTRRMLKEARRLGADVVRFATLASNTPMVRLAAGFEFTQVARIVPYQAEGLSKKVKAAPRAEARDLARLLVFMKESAGFAAAAGLFSTGWRFHLLTDGIIRKKLEQGKVRVKIEGGSIRAAAILEAGHPGEGPAVSYADGEPAALAALALALRLEAAGNPPARINARLAELPHIINAFAAAGYEPMMDSSLMIFERNL